LYENYSENSLKGDLERKKERLFIFSTQHTSVEKIYELTLYTIYEDKQIISSICPKGKRAG
jgi:hypothetical protein